MRLLLYDDPDDLEPAEVIELDPETDRWGDTWRCFVRGIGHGQLYHVQTDGPWQPDHGQWFHGNMRLIDPYAKALAGDFQQSEDGIIRPPKCVIIDDCFDWEGDRCLQYDLADSIIYEMHVKGFTQSATSRVENPGTYLGVIEKIPYLQSLGITAVELMPVHEFPILGSDGRKLHRPNYWGYDPMAFFSPHRGYAMDDEPGAQVTEFKQMVKALHSAGIEVILDVVFNHTCEGNERGPVLSFKGLENRVYYMTTPDGRHYKNYSGCGNTLNCNHPIVRELILDCLRHWVVTYHVDGFRFDLASILNRGRDGGLHQNAPLVEAIADDPLLARTKIIAEAWDAGGAYQVGNFGGPRWAEWNGRYRDDVRRYWRGDEGMLGPFATRLAGSSDLYQHNGRRPSCSVNFITSHDGYTMNDLVSYCHKHNEANSEGNRDGDNNNLSANYGIEGPTDSREIEAIRVRQIKNMLTSLMLSQGVPMLVAGDECRRTQGGNNNAYCQDNEVSWFDWQLVKSNRELVRFCRALIRFRRNQPTLRRRTFLSGQPSEGGRPDVSWYDARGNTANWDGYAKTLTCLLTALPTGEGGEKTGRDVLLMMNASHTPQEFIVPASIGSTEWRLFIDTAAEAPRDIFASNRGPALPESGRQILASRSMVCYVARKSVAS
jgi:glycogen operon protein